MPITKGLQRKYTLEKNEDDQKDKGRGQTLAEVEKKKRKQNLKCTICKITYAS